MAGVLGPNRSGRASCRLKRSHQLQRSVPPCPSAPNRPVLSRRTLVCTFARSLALVLSSLVGDVGVLRGYRMMAQVAETVVRRNRQRQHPKHQRDRNQRVNNPHFGYLSSESQSGSPIKDWASPPTLSEGRSPRTGSETTQACARLSMTAKNGKVEKRGGDWLRPWVSWRGAGAIPATRSASRRTSALG